VSFVRTLMPWFAGMSRMSWPRFFLFDLFGVIGWGVASVMAGYLAGESWTVLARWLGRASALVVVAIVLTILTVVYRRRRRGAPAAGPAAEAAPDAAPEAGTPPRAEAGPHAVSDPPDAPLSGEA
jgi:hypothetical protein